MKLSTLLCIATGIVATATSTRSAVVLSQNFDTDPVNYTNSPFAFQASDPARYWGPSNGGMTVNPGVTGNATTYLAGQNMDADGDGTLAFTTGAPAQINFVVLAAGHSDLRLSINLAGMPTAETENFVRAFVDTDGDGVFESPLFNFAGTNNSPYTDTVLGALSGAFATYANIPVPAPTAADGMLRLRLEMFSDTNSQNEALGVDDIIVEGTVIPEPGSAMLGALCSLGFFRRRRISRPAAC